MQPVYLLHPKTHGFKCKVTTQKTSRSYRHDDPPYTAWHEILDMRLMPTAGVFKRVSWRPQSSVCEVRGSGDSGKKKNKEKSGLTSAVQP